MKKSSAVIVVVVFALLLFAGGIWLRLKNVSSVDPNLYQVVFLDGNQHYFGHLKNFGTKYPYLTDVYYVKPGAPNPDKPGEQFTLVKMGNEIHGPDDVLYFNWEKMLFWQNLKPDSKVVKGIAEQKASQTGTVVTPTPLFIPAQPAAPAVAPTK